MELTGSPHKETHTYNDTPTHGNPTKEGGGKWTKYIYQANTTGKNRRKRRNHRETKKPNRRIKTRRSPRNSNKVITKAIIVREKRHAQAWFDRECYKERKETLQALHAAKLYQRPADLTTYAEKEKNTKH